jgi:hypothetical protein
MELIPNDLFGLNYFNTLPILTAAVLIETVLGSGPIEMFSQYLLEGPRKTM